MGVTDWKFGANMRSPRRRAFAVGLALEGRFTFEPRLVAEGWLGLVGGAFCRGLAFRKGLGRKRRAAIGRGCGLLWPLLLGLGLRLWLRFWLGPFPLRGCPLRSYPLWPSPVRPVLLRPVLLRSVVLGPVMMWASVLTRGLPSVFPR